MQNPLGGTQPPIYGIIYAYEKGSNEDEES